MNRIVDFLLKNLVNNLIIRADVSTTAKHLNTPPIVEDINAKILAESKKTTPPPSPPSPPAPVNPFEAGKSNIPPNGDTDKFLKEHFGDKFKNIDEIKKVIENSGKVSEETQKELTTLKEIATKHATLQKEYESEKKSKIFNNETLYKLDRLYEKDKKQFELLNKVLHITDPMEILTAEFISTHPTYENKRDVVQELIFEQYDVKLEPETKKNDEGEDEIIEGAATRNEKKKRMVKEKMNLAAEEAKNKMLKTLDTIDIPKQLNDEDKKKLDEDKKKEFDGKQKEYINKWNPYYDKITKEITKIETSIPNDKSTLDISIDLTDSEKAEINKIVADLIFSVQKDPTDELVSNIKELAVGYYIGSNAKTIIPKLGKQIGEQISKMTSEEIKKFIYNPGELQSPESRSSTSRTKNEESHQRALDNAQRK